MREKEIVPIDGLSMTEATQIVRQLVEDELGGALEFISTVWFFSDITRAFQQQLTRHRQFGFCIQSMRVIDKKGFAERGEYLMPDDVKDKTLYKSAMLTMQTVYHALLDRGEEEQVARGVLPLNVYSPIAMVANMRNLLHMMELNLTHGQLLAKI